MEGRKLSLFIWFFLLSLLSVYNGVNGSNHRHHHHAHKKQFDYAPVKLFVFGDSYVDTGNVRKSMGSSWNVPYGITFPGKPAGRFSDGRVSTDFLAKFVGVKSPIQYTWRRVGGQKALKHGMNFAFGGTGVFDTLVPLPNMTTQIDFFQQLLDNGVYTTADLGHSIALVSAAGNDYSAYVERTGSVKGLASFITKVVTQLALNLKRIHGLGVRKIVVPALQPIGCLPRRTFESSYRLCNGTENLLADLHNGLLQEAVANLNNQTKDSAFMILDLYDAFTTVLKNKGEHPGCARFENPLKPCCIGVSPEYSCGSVDETGAKMYTVCDDPQSRFFWDAVHPTQEGWRSVFSVLQANLKQLLNNRKS